MAIAAAAYAFGDRLLDGIDYPHTGQCFFFRVQAGRKKRYRADLHRLQLHLGLPFVDVGVLLFADVGEKTIAAQIDQTALRFDVFRRAHAF